MIKHIVRLMLVLPGIWLLVSCCSVPEAYEDKSDKDKTALAKAKSNPYPLNQFACRENDAAHVEKILKALDDHSGVVLYFHGGLSSQKYMQKNLGPLLRESMLTDENMAAVNQQKPLYPLFVNYDAGLLDSAKSIEVWEKQLKKYLKRVALRAAIGLFKQDALSKTTGNYYKELLDDSIVKASGGMLKSLDAASSINAYTYLLSDKSQLEKSNLGFSYDDVWASLSEAPNIREIERLTKNAAYTESGRKSVIGFDASKVILRSIVRIALGTNHQVVPTFEEEFIRELAIWDLKLQDIAVGHWNNVKLHSKQCFSRANGASLVKKLVSLKKQRGDGFTIHTISHSAGSIPTARLAEKFASHNIQIDTANLIVPAINQDDFYNILVKHKSAINKMRLYVLDRTPEEDDSTAYIYPASLLYFVSGSAEGVWYGDKLLLIEQHLKDESPYNWDTYLNKVKEKPGRIRDYFKQHSDELVYYPGERFKEGDHEPGAASHECTKYPWVARDLAGDILTSITGTGGLQIKLPLDGQRYIDKCNCIVEVTEEDFGDDHYE